MWDSIQYSRFIRDIRILMRTDGPWQWVIAIILAIIATIIIKALLRALETHVASRLGRWTRHFQRYHQFEDTIFKMLAQTKPYVIFVWILYPFIEFMYTNRQTNTISRGVLIVATSLQVTLWGFYIVRRWRENFLSKKVGKDDSSVSALGLMSATLKGFIATTVLLICLNNLGINVGALVAGLGVGGIAVALAAQNFLGDVFASLSIVLDKPFIVGDFIMVGTEMGTVENIGIKTTRVRSLSGEELIFSNRQLLEGSIKNFKRMWRRRVVIRFSVPYSTSREHVQDIPVWIKEWISAQDQLEFDRCHLAQFGEWSLNFELVYWVKDPDYGLHMDLQQNFYLHLIERFQKHRVQFAIPGQSLFVEKFPRDLMSLSSWKEEGRPDEVQRPAES